MFGLFRKKKARRAPTPHPAQHEVQHAVVQPSAVVQRRLCEWDAAIVRIRGEFETMVVEALGHSEPLLACVQTDIEPLEQLWESAERQLEKSQRALANAWNGPYSALYGDAAVTEQQLAAEEDKLYIQSTELELALQAAFRQVRARAAQAMMQYALHQDAGSRYCLGCGSGLVMCLVGQAQNIQCPSCGLAQVAEPGQAFRIFAGSAARWVGEWDGFVHYQGMRRAETRISRYRNTKDVPMPLLHEFSNAATQYWQTSLGVEAHLVPHLAKHAPATVNARLKDARRLLRNHWQWRAYEERARALEARSNNCL